MKNKILTYLEKLAETIGNALMISEGIFIVNNKIIKITNGRRW
jgi:hypothetical protein